MKIITKLLKLDQKRGSDRVYWRVQDSRFPLPTKSASGWSKNDFDYKEGQVSFFANLINAIETLLGATDEFGNDYAKEIEKNGGTAVLLAAISEYETEDAAGAEIIVWEPKEVGRWQLTAKELKEILDKIA